MSRTSFKPSLVAAAVIGAIALSGCGGGGDSDTTASTAPFSASASGVAAKGIIKFATVTAYELDNTGRVVRTVGTGETDATGKYSLTIDSSYTGGPLKLELSAKDDGSTKMVCDVPVGCGGSAYGGDYPLPPAFTLVAFHQAAKSGSVVKAQITPYSHMAAARIQAQMEGGAALDDALIANAISEVSQVVGVDISQVEPVDITNRDALTSAQGDALQYAAFNAGIGVIAFSNPNGFEAGIQAAAASFADGKFDGSDAVSIASIVEAVSAMSLLVPELNTTALTATLASIEANITSDGTFDPEPAPAATQTAVAQAKGMVSQIRTWGTELVKLKDPADAFALDVETAAAVINSDSGALAGVFGSVISGAVNTVLTEAESPSGLQATTYTFPVTHWTATGPVTTNGAVQVLDNGGTLKLVISAANSGVDANATVTTNIPSTVLGKSGPLDFALLTMTASGGASMTSPAPAKIDFADATLSLAYKVGKTRATATDADIASITMAGGVSMAANGVTFAGHATVGVVSNNAVGAISLEELTLSGTFTGPKGSASAAASLKVDNAATFDTFGLLNHEPVLWPGNQLPDDAWQIAEAYAAATRDTLQFAYYDSLANQTCSQGLLVNYSCQAGDIYGLGAKAETALKAEYPTALSVQNVYAGYSVGYGTYYGAMLTFGDFESASNFAQGTITASANVALAGYPSATLTVTAKRTAYTDTSPVAGNVVAILSYNGQNLTVEANNTEAVETLTITNPDGVKLVVSSGDQVTGDIKVNGEPVGTVSSSSGVPLIRYADGTFESLN